MYICLACTCTIDPNVEASFNTFDKVTLLTAKYLEKKTRQFFACCRARSFSFSLVHPRFTRRLIKTGRGLTRMSKPPSTRSIRSRDALVSMTVCVCLCVSTVTSTSAPHPAPPRFTPPINCKHCRSGYFKVTRFISRMIYLNTCSLTLMRHQP